jgi:hypothetical protein
MLNTSAEVSTILWIRELASATPVATQAACMGASSIEELGTKQYDNDATTPNPTGYNKFRYDLPH